MMAKTEVSLLEKEAEIVAEKADLPPQPGEVVSIVDADRVTVDGKPVKDPPYIGKAAYGTKGWSLEQAVHYYCDLIEANSGSSGELEAALQRLRDLSSYEPYFTTAQDPYAKDEDDVKAEKAEAKADRADAKKKADAKDAAAEKKADKAAAEKKAEAQKAQQTGTSTYGYRG